LLKVDKRGGKKELEEGVARRAVSKYIHQKKENTLKRKRHLSNPTMSALSLIRSSTQKNLNAILD